MSEVRRGRGLYSALAYLPVVVPPVVSVLLWRFFYDASAHGVFNSDPRLVRARAAAVAPELGSAMPSIVIESTWANAGATVIIYLAALVSVPPELYDAADVDGASIWQKIRNITLPQLRSVLLLTLILQLIATAQVFTEPLLFTSGGPNNATLTVLLLIYRYAFQNSLGGDYGMAAALSLMLAGVPGDLHAGYYRLTAVWSRARDPAGARGAARPRPTSIERGIISSSEWRQRRIRWPMRFLQGATLVFLLDRRARAAAVDDQVVDHADPGHAARRRWRCGPRASTSASSRPPGRGPTSTATCSTRSSSRSGRGRSSSSSRRRAATPCRCCGRAFSGLLTGLVIATIFVPPIVLLVPLYLTIVDVPLVHVRMIDSYWAIWLPAGASAVNVVLIKRFFDNLPREIFEAARVDGAGPFRLFWSIVLPMSRPILGVVSVFAVIATWKDYLWPLLVIRNPNLQPLSVRLPTLQPSTDLGVFIAALTISSLIPIVLFLLFQRLFLSGAGVERRDQGLNRAPPRR